MKISLNWLKDFIDISIPAEQVSEILTDIGLEVEKMAEVDTVPGGLKGLLIGEVVSTELHPNADRLKITQVSLGENEMAQIVCGAPNVAAGQKVVVAVPGTTIYPTSGEPFKIKKSKIRGVESLGMICAEDEIGLGHSHEGIMVLDSSAPVGIEAAKYFNVESDIVFEIGLTPNRADAMSHYGVARDLMVAFKHKGVLSDDAKICRHSVTEFACDSKDLTIPVEVENKEACPRYASVSISGVAVKDSPKWLKDRLNAIGVRPINNIVDVTNYVLHELGQPLHAFDADVVGDKVFVGNMPEGSKFVTLDEVERELSEADLMIKNGSGGMCIAGVFGGNESGVTEKTTKVFLESAYFDPVSVRKTAKRHGLNTDASFRFERGIDPNITVHALKRAALLIKELAGGLISSEISDIQSKVFEPFEFDVSLEKLCRLVGVDIPEKVVVSILNNLSIQTTKKDEDTYMLEVPPYRVDVQREADIAEEILRIYGFNNVSLPEKLNSSITHREELDKEKVQHLISDLLVDKGLVEAMSNSLTKSNYSSLIETKEVRDDFEVRMLNPLSTDLDVMRQTLLFGGLEAVRLNQNHGNEDVGLFEFGKIYQKFESDFSERKLLALFLSGNQEPEAWNSNKGEFSFYTLKGLVEAILTKLGILKNHNYSAVKSAFFEDGMELSIAKKRVARMGWVNGKLKEHFDLRNAVFYAEIDWDVVLSLLKMNKVKFKELNKFPAVTRDLSMLVDKPVKFEELLETAEKAERKLLKRVSLFDVYEGKNLPEGKKSYALRFVLHDESKTLKDKEIEKSMERIQSALEKSFNIQLR
ncbi:phenylalanine--tRNA ligase subunit beta [Parvicella tangerina]|uniref:Phenylalanine--tRNA ligase beta subunit n=1 Tax=Parvicella tangerina TaxID=2829795 RepID=A0A916NEZ3_9FLAO|nr:phenylalanine--tRNA ligase subunit beta [Parvicella tangerina]CAG5076502.1 Phenylalanine--tRNA ligase beta subunit [Parvicella tangerina]